MKKACSTEVTMHRLWMHRMGTGKVLMLLTALLLLGSVDTFAQKKNVIKAKAKLLTEPRDLKAAKEAILPALRDSTSNKLANTWFVAGEVFWSIYDEQQKIEWNQNRGDKALMGESLKMALDCYIKADSLDRVPNSKGKVKPKFSNKIIDRTLSFHKVFPNVASFHSEKKDYMNAIDMFGQYLRYKDIPYLRGRGLERDSLNNLVVYYSGISATQANKPEVAIKFYEQVKDSMDQETNAWIYSRLSEDYSTLKDSNNMLRMYQLGARRFPNNTYYSKNLINFYVAQHKMKEAMVWINTAISQDDKNAPFWYVKGRILENDSLQDEALQCYEKAVSLNSDLADAYGSIGRIYYNIAVEDFKRVNGIKDDRKYIAEKKKLKEVYLKSKPYLEKAHELDPKDRSYLTALRGIYYFVDDNENFKRVEELLKSK